ncbi:hypothetical protein [Reichenbachiella faecimaris]|uniref:hypothetical protein n=1 Tax=Reichenbachiella faecimaris TaxID=692418 RepID=UPI001FE778BA|nr:hypothetical protein [Reichenbachiella faecimaris]
MRESKHILYLLIAAIFLNSCSEATDQLLGLTPANDVELGKSVVAQIEADPTNYPILPEANYPEAYEYIQNMTAAIVACQ